MLRRPTLRMIVVVVAGLTGLKVWAQDRYHRAIFHEALIAAYQDKAEATCQKAFARFARSASPARLREPEVVIGSPAAQVAVWDFDNPLWDVRYRHPHILLKAETMGELRCAYDLSSGIASFETVPPAGGSARIANAR